MSEKIKIALPIIVEGRYDKSTLSGFLDATVVTTGGFSVFNNKEKQALIRRLAGEGGIILLTDSDGGGRQIRSFISGIVAGAPIHHLHIPKIEGKEKRKLHASRSGLLGVEGMEKETLLRLLEPFRVDAKDQKERKMITKLDFFEHGLAGGENSSALRATVAKRAGLPDDMTAKALLEALNLLYGYEEFLGLLDGSISERTE